MTTTVGLRDLARNSNILDGYDYVEVKDKKTQEYKGLFISPKHADDFKRYLKEKISKEMQKKLDEIEKFSASCTIEERFNDLSSSQIREKIAKEKYAQK